MLALGGHLAISIDGQDGRSWEAWEVLLASSG